MKHSRFLDIIGTILLFIGFALAFLPHAAHVALGFGNDVSHLKHVILGMILVITALAILIINNNALSVKKKNKKIYNNN